MAIAKQCIALGVVSALALVGCGSSDSSADAAPVAPQPKVSAGNPTGTAPSAQTMKGIAPPPLRPEGP